MISRGHCCELVTINRGTVMSSISQILVDEENRRRYKEGWESMDSNTRVSFLATWLSKNKSLLDSEMGVRQGNKYSSGIVFTPSVSLEVAHEMQNVFQADACHVFFGKYTIYTAYGSCADGSMFPLTFAILFSNETAAGWGRFWEFTIRHYPFLNCPEITVITDQDKGSINAIEQHLPQACHFFCSWHRRGNVLCWEMYLR